MRISLYTINIAGLRGSLFAVPGKGGNAAALKLEISLPDGSVAAFSVFSSSVLAPQAAYGRPEIKTYAGKGVPHTGVVSVLSVFDA